MDSRKIREKEMSKNDVDNAKINELEEELKELKDKNEFLKKNQAQMQEIYEGEDEKLLNEFQEYKSKYPTEQT